MQVLQIQLPGVQVQARVVAWSGVQVQAVELYEDVFHVVAPAVGPWQQQQRLNLPFTR
jgi:hypothetical protein